MRVSLCRRVGLRAVCYAGRILCFLRRFRLTMLQKGAASMTPEETLAVKLRLRKKA